MEQKTLTVLFALLRSAVFDKPLTAEERALFSPETLKEMAKIAAKHDLQHLFAQGLKKSGLVESDPALDRMVLKAAFRQEQLDYARKETCKTLEKARIPFLPLKGSVLQTYYPEAWMRTSCDVDILVCNSDLSAAIAQLVQTLGYEEKERGTHDVLLRTATGQSVELHFDLVEEGRANQANRVLAAVWENVSLQEGQNYWYEMSDAFFYFYHIAHMAKHFESGGCGIRPFIDLLLLDALPAANEQERAALLKDGGLLRFAESARRLARVWFAQEEPDELSLRMQEYVLRGGVYGTSDNKVAIQQQKKGGRTGYFLSRVFVPYDKLKRYYPVLEKHRWLTPLMQVRRWFMLFDPSVAQMAKREIELNSSMEKTKADLMLAFLSDIGL